MIYTDLGSTGLQVSAVALGCWQLAGDLTWGRQEEGDSLAAVDAALELGINFFDNAEMYGEGRAEEILGKSLLGRRDRAIIASKVNRKPMTQAAVMQACEESLKRLRTDYIDLYQIHFIDRGTPLEETAAGFLELKKAGKIRAFGTCNSGVQDLTELMRLEKIQTNQMPYSLLWRAIEFQIQGKCLESQIGLLCYSPLAQGLLTGKFSSAEEVPPGRARTRHFSKSRPHTRHGEPGFERETFAAIEEIRSIALEAGVPMARLSLAWVLHQRGVVSVLCGARNPRQVRENALAAELSISEETLARLSEATEELKALLGPNPDPWQADSRAK